MFPSSSDSYLRQSFVKVAQNAHVAMNWKYLCRYLGLSEVEINDVENTHTSMRDRWVDRSQYVLDSG